MLACAGQGLTANPQIFPAIIVAGTELEATTKNLPLLSTAPLRPPVGMYKTGTSSANK